MVVGERAVDGPSGGEGEGLQYSGDVLGLTASVIQHY